MLQLEPLSTVRCNVPHSAATARNAVRSGVRCEDPRGTPLFMFVGIASAKALNLASDRRPRGLEDAAPAGGHVEDEAYSAWEVDLGCLRMSLWVRKQPLSWGDVSRRIHDYPLNRRGHVTSP